MSEAAVSLDDDAVRARIDQDGSYERIHGLPEQCLEAWQAAKDFDLPPDFRQVERVVVAGMGGSAIAGDFLQALAADSGRVAVTVVRGYDLPRWLDERALVIACSHSGNTEETLSCFEAALRIPARKLVITTGGRLLDLAREHGVPAMTYTYPNVPRDAFGHGFVRLLAVARALGMHPIDDEAMLGAVADMRRLRALIEWQIPESENEAKKHARSLAGSVPLIVGAGFLAPVARRWRTQMNENADVLAFWDELPELDHNLVVGLRHPKDLLGRVRAIFLDHAALHPRTRLRYGLTLEIFGRAGITGERRLFTSSQRFAAQLCAVHLGDLVSYYLALLLGTRPVEVESINWLKDRLSEQ